MKFKKLVAILLVTISMISVLGGCMDKQVDNETIRNEQDRMVLFLINNYEGVEKVEFTSFEQNPSTQTWKSNAIVNNQVYITFSIQSLENDSDIGVGQHIKRSQNSRLKEKESITKLTDIDDIEVLYWED